MRVRVPAVVLPGLRALGITRRVAEAPEIGARAANLGPAELTVVTLQSPGSHSITLSPLLAGPIANPCVGLYGSTKVPVPLAVLAGSTYANGESKSHE